MGHVYDLLKFSLKQEGRDDIVCFHRSDQLIFGRLPKNFYNDHCLVTIAAVIILSYLIVQIQRLSFTMILFFVLILLETTSYNFYLPTLSLQISIEHEI